VLLATTGLVLLIACANLANLLLAAPAYGSGRSRCDRPSAPRGEAHRTTSGGKPAARRDRGRFGSLLAQVVSRGLIAFLSTQNSPLFVGLGIDARVLGFTSAVAVGTCLLFGLLPALRATRVAAASVMRSSGRGLSAGRERFGLRRALVAGQVALSLVLLVGALLFVRSLQKLLKVDAGFRTEGAVAVNLDLRRPQYAKERRPIIYRNLLDRLSAQPGVISAAQVLMTPVSGAGWNDMIRPEAVGGASKESYFNRVGPAYFRTMGTTLVAGRDFDARDTVDSPKVAIVNELFVERILGGGNPLAVRSGWKVRPGSPIRCTRWLASCGIRSTTSCGKISCPSAFFPWRRRKIPALGRRLS